jgi:hypothetical protein
MGKLISENKGAAKAAPKPVAKPNKADSKEE